MNIAKKLIPTSLLGLCGLGLVCLSTNAAAEETHMLINYGLSGSWYEPATSGQGFVIDILPLNNLLAAYWFTYPVEGGGCIEPVAGVADPQERGLADDIERGRDIDPKHYKPKTLRQVLRQTKRLPIREGLNIATHLIASLAYLQRNGLLHRPDCRSQFF